MLSRHTIVLGGLVYAVDPAPGPVVETAFLWHCLQRGDIQAVHIPDWLYFLLTRIAHWYSLCEQALTVAVSVERA